MNASELRKAISTGLASPGSSALNDWINEYCSYCFEDGDWEGYGPFPQDVSDLYCECLRDREFLESEGTADVLFVLEHEWARMDMRQREALLPCLKAAYPQLRDPNARFVVAELLGRFFANWDSLRTLLAMTGLPSVKHRELIPMALDQMVRNSKDRELSKEALRVLQSLQNDPSQEVRKEVDISLDRLRADGVEVERSMHDR